MKHNGPHPDVVTVEELARILGIGRNQAYAAVKSGQIASVRIGRRFLIPRKILNGILGSTPELTVPKMETAPLVHRVLRGGARLSAEQLNEFTETIDALSNALRDVGDMLMRLRRIRDELIKKSNRAALEPKPAIAPCDDAEFGMKP